jgi:hypothetical protein
MDLRLGEANSIDWRYCRLPVSLLKAGCGLNVTATPAARTATDAKIQTNMVSFFIVILEVRIWTCAWMFRLIKANFNRFALPRWDFDVSWRATPRR